jgi:hypothetical protein
MTSETGSGTFSATSAGHPSVVSLSGKVKGSTITGSESVTITVSNLPVPDGECAGGRYKATANAVLTKSASLNLAETGTYCFDDSLAGIGHTENSFTASYAVNGSTSTGRFAGTSGSGVVTYILKPAPVATAGTYTSAYNPAGSTGGGGGGGPIKPKPPKGGH